MRNFIRTVALVCLLVLTAPVVAQSIPAKDSLKFLAAFREVVRKPSESVVRVRCADKDVALGAVVSKDGHVLTKASELKDNPVCKLADGRSLNAQVVASHVIWDLALLKVEADNLAPVEWRKSTEVSPGSWVASVGPDIDPVAIGVLGAPAFDIPAREVFNPNRVGGGFLGVRLAQDVGGVKVTFVEPDHGAKKAGVKVGDVITAIDGKAVPDVDALMDAVSAHKPEDSIKIKLLRGTEEMELKATLGKRPTERADFQDNLGSKLSTRRQGFPTVLQHDTILRTSDCGGPLVDLDGKVVGINIARAGRVHSDAIPSEVLQKLLPDLMSGKSVTAKDK